MSAEMNIVFTPVGDDAAIGAIKTVTKHVKSLKQISATDLNMKSITDSISGADLRILQDVVAKADKAANAMKHLGIEYERTAKKMKSPLMPASGNAHAGWDMAQMFTKKAGGMPADDRPMGRMYGPTRDDWYEGKRQNFLAARAAEADRVSQASAPMGPMFGPTREDMYNGRRQEWVAKQPIQPQGMFEKFQSALGMGKFANQTKEMDSLTAAMKRNKNAAAEANQTLGLFGRILVGMFIRSAVRGALEYADAFTNLQNRIRSVTEGEGSLGLVTKQMFQIASASRSSAEAITTMYTRTTRAVKGLGLSQKEVLQFTETLSKAIVIGGSSAVEASNAMIQLSQGMGSGALRGDELRSVLEQLPIVASLIAEEMKVPVSSLRKLGSEGKITTEVIVAAVNKATDEMNEKFRTMPLTFAQAMQGLKNKAVEKSAELSGVMSSLADAIQGVTNNFDSFATGAVTLGILLGEVGLIKIVTMLATTFKGLGIAIKSSMGWVGAIVTGLSMVTIALGPVISKLKVGENSAVNFGTVMSAMWDEFLGESEQGNEELETMVVKTAEISDNFKLTVRWAAQVGDIIMGWLNPIQYVYFALEKLTGETNKSLTEYMQNFSGFVNKAMKRAEDVTYQNETDRMLQEEQEAYADDLQWDKDDKTKNPDTKDKKEHGKTFQELMVEAEIEANKWAEGRYDGKKKTLENRVFEQALDGFKELKKSEQQRVLANEGMVKELQHVIRVKETWKDVYELIEVIEKAALESMKKEWDDFAAELDNIIKKTKDAQDAVKEFQEAKADREQGRYDKFNDIAGGLDPNMATNQQILDLEKFQKFAKTNKLPEWAELSRQKIEELKRSMRWENGPLQEFASQMNSTFGQGGTLVKGFADVAANALVASQSMREFANSLKGLLESIQKQAISSMIQLPLNLALGGLTNMMGGTLPSAGGAAALPTGGSSTGFTPAPRSLDAGNPYIGMHGGNTGDSWKADNLPGLASGGYTGNVGTNTVAGMVHGQEYVLNAQATRRVGKENLDVINKGGSVAPKAAAPTININNNAAGIDVQASVSPTTGEIEVMIERKMAQRIDGAVAQRINDPNSKTSRAISGNVDASRRR